MPDIIYVLSRWWKIIIVTSILTSLVAFTVTMLLPKKYLSIVTALPSNSALGDKSRLFNQNIQILYPEIGLVDELDKLEGTAALDTLYISVINSLNLVEHYKKESNSEGINKALRKVKRNSKISRTEYGELKIRAWDTNSDMAAAIANSLTHHLQEIHRNLLMRNNEIVIHRMRDNLNANRNLFSQLTDSINKASPADAELASLKKTAIADEILGAEKIINQYEAALHATPNVLLVVEHGRPSVYPDKPKVWQSVLLTFFASCIFFFLLGVFIESNKESV